MSFTFGASLSISGPSKTAWKLFWFTKSFWYKSKSKSKRVDIVGTGKRRVV